MIGKRGFALQDYDDGVQVAGLERISDRRWRLERWERVDAERAEGPVFRRGLDPLDVAWLLPNQETQLAATPLPRLKAKDTARAVAGWIAREEQGQPEQWASAWMERGDTEPADGMADLVLMYAEQEKIRSGLDRAEALGAEPGRVLPGYAALDRLYRLVGAADGAESWNLIFLGRDSSFLCIGTSDAVLLTRPLPVDHSGGTEAEEYLQRLTTEIQRAMFFARQSVGLAQVQRVVVCGDEDLASRLAAALGESASSEAVHWDLTEHFELGDRDVDVDAWPLLAGAALGGVRGDLNLLPEARPSLVPQWVKLRFHMTAAVVSVVLTPLVWILGTTLVDLQEGYLETGRRQLRVAEREAKAAQLLYREHALLEERRGLIGQYRSRGRDLDQVLIRLAEMAPTEVTFRDLRIVETDGGGLLLSLTGESRDRSAAGAQQGFLDFLEALEGSDLLGRRGEPRELEISRPAGDKLGGQCVTFSLDYDLPAAGGGEESDA